MLHKQRMAALKMPRRSVRIQHEGPFWADCEIYYFEVLSPIDEQPN
ncbi:hypothetical protein RB2150_08528 [Rhodobacterales bacterium HTCC2150]|nr:hypothetical protein RB2150_08528 [Rhodobacterales bacterium HTCC2150] [Rhodobacteraceae bacterium HTCC2150]